MYWSLIYWKEWRIDMDVTNPHYPLPPDGRGVGLHLAPLFSRRIANVLPSPLQGTGQFLTQ